MSSEELESERQRIWRPVRWLAMAASLLVIVLLILHHTGHLSYEIVNRIAAAGFAIFLFVYILVGYWTLEMPIRGYRLRFENRPVLFAIWFVFMSLAFILFFWHSLDIDR